MSAPSHDVDYSFTMQGVVCRCSCGWSSNVARKDNPHVPGAEFVALVRCADHLSDEGYTDQAREFLSQRADRMRA